MLTAGDERGRQDLRVTQVRDISVTLRRGSRTWSDINTPKIRLAEHHLLDPPFGFSFRGDVSL
jgi:hypothetical protein